MQEDLEEANEEVEQLRKDRSRQIDMVAQIVRQRDMYKVLLSTETVSTRKSFKTNYQNIF